MSDYNDKELWSAKPSWDTVYQTPKEKYQYAYNRECGWRYQGRLEKDGWVGSITSFKRAASCRLIMCSCNCALNYNYGRVYKENFQTKVRIGSRM
jgi:hypothetical protein